MQACRQIGRLIHDACVKTERSFLFADDSAYTICTSDRLGLCGGQPPPLPLSPPYEKTPQQWATMTGSRRINGTKDDAKLRVEC